MNTHDFAKLLLASPAQTLTSLGANEKYPERYNLKGLRIPGVASIGGWLYPTTNAVAEDSEAPVRTAPPVKPQVRVKRLNEQVQPSPVAVQAARPSASKPQPASKPQTSPDAALMAQVAELLQRAGIKF